MAKKDLPLHFQYQKEDFQLEEEERHKNWILNILSKESISIEEINIIFTTDDFLLELNKKYLDHNYFTDILTFPFQQDPLQTDLYISIDRVKENAVNLAIPFEYELRRVMIHGILHNLKYDDHTEDDIAKMRAKEEACLRLY